VIVSLNIKNPRTLDLVQRLAQRTGETQTAAVTAAVAAQLDRLDGADAGRRAAVQRLLEQIWAHHGADAREHADQRATDLYDDAGLPR
jgi:hypothetical protein